MKRGYPDNHDPKAHVREASFNHKILHPLIKRMGLQKDDEGNIPLFSIGQVEAQILACRKKDFPHHWVFQASVYKYCNVCGFFGLVFYASSQNEASMYTLQS